MSLQLCICIVCPVCLVISLFSAPLSISHLLSALPPCSYVSAICRGLTYFLCSWLFFRQSPHSCPLSCVSIIHFSLSVLLFLLASLSKSPPANTRWLTHLVLLRDILTAAEIVFMSFYLMEFLVYPYLSFLFCLQFLDKSCALAWTRSQTAYSLFRGIFIISECVYSSPQISGYGMADSRISRCSYFLYLVVFSPILPRGGHIVCFETSLFLNSLHSFPVNCVFVIVASSVLFSFGLSLS